MLIVAGLVYLNLSAWGDVMIGKEPTTMPVRKPTTQPSSPLDFVVTTIDGEDKNLSDYRGQVVLIVNVASKCGLTPQYAALQKLYEKYKDQGLVIIGFPANNFGGQEPGSNEEVKTFCTTKYNVTFPMMAKISVKGKDKAPLYQFLTSKDPAGEFAGEIEWNFAKFLVDREGHLVARFPSRTTPDDPKVIETLEKTLAAQAPTSQP